jgi:hypothetical protein
MDEIEKNEKRRLRNEYSRKYRQENADRINKKARENRAKNSDYIKAYRKKNHHKYKEKADEYKKQWYQKNKERVKQKRKKYYYDNKEKILNSLKIYKAKNKEKININAKNYMVSRRKRDIRFRILCTLRCRISKFISKDKNDSTCLKLLGCTINELKTHLEKRFKQGMTWGNYGKKGWHIDHIIPCASFNLTDMKQQREECFHYTNLQPLWWWENLSKGKKNPHKK